MPRLYPLPFGEREAVDADAVEEFAQGYELCRIGLVVDAVHAGLFQPLQLLGRGDIGGDHEFFDEPVAVEALARLDARHPWDRAR